MDRVVADTGFLSTLLKGDLVQIAMDILEIDELYITSDVQNELDRCESLSIDKYDHIKVVKYRVEISPNESLGVGEMSCIEYCKEHGFRLLIDDRKARDRADKKGIPTLTIPDLLYLGKSNNKVDKHEMREIIEKIRTTDNYVFSKEVKDELLG